MSKLAMVVALIGLAACGSKAGDAPAADSAAVAPAPAAAVDSSAPADSMARDTTTTQ